MVASPRRSIARTAGGTVLAIVLVACRGMFTGAESTPTPTVPVSAATPSASPTMEASTVLSSSTAGASASALPSPAGPFTLTSPAFTDGAAIPKANTCDGADRSPELRWANAPAGTAAFVLEVVDPDAHDWVHWLVVDVPGSPNGSIPAGVGTGSGAPQQGRNSFGKVGWGGPCPPSGTHHYVFTLFALDSRLGLSGNPDRTAIDQAMASHHILAKASLTGTYRRS